MNMNPTVAECIHTNRFPQETVSKEISEKIKFGSFLMTCIVVCYHCRGFDDANGMGTWDILLNDQVRHFMEKAGSLAMCYFFSITGFLLFQNFNFQNYPQKIRRRISSLLIPYLVWQLLYFMTKVLLCGEAYPLTGFLRQTFCLEKWPLNGPLWYVYSVFLLALASPILLALFQNKRIAWPSTVLLILLLRFLRETDNPIVNSVTHYGYLSNTLYYLPFYLIGCYLGRFSKENTNTDVFLCFFSMLCISYFLDDLFPSFFFQTTVGLMPLMGLYVLPLPPVLQNKPIYRLSFLMYAIHQPLLFNVEESVRTGLMLVSPMPVFFQSILAKAIILALDVVLSFCIHALFKRCCPRILSLISGGRAS